MSISSRAVKRVLVMLDYGEGDPASGEVFDLTALALEVGGKADMHHGQITLKVSAATELGIAAKSPAPAFTPGCSMKRICSWCGEFLGLITCTASQHGKVSHTICAVCKERYTNAEGAR